MSFTICTSLAEEAVLAAAAELYAGKLLHTAVTIACLDKALGSHSGVQDMGSAFSP